MTRQSAATAQRRRHVVPLIAVVAIAMLGAVLTLAASTQSAQAQGTVTPAVCYTVDEGNGANDNHLVQVDIAADTSVTFTDLGVINNGGAPPVDARNIEAVAYRNGFEPRAIYTQDPATDDLLRINRTDGTDVLQVASVDIGDIDGLTWRFDNDTDPTNDELWGVIRNAGDPEDEIVEIDPVTGTLIGTPVTIQTNGTNEDNDVDGLAWDPADGLFYAPVNGSSRDNNLITIDPLTGAVNVIGLVGIEDIEGIGFDDTGQLYGMTGDDGSTPNEMILIDKVTAAGVSIGPITIYGDYESLDCAGVLPADLGDKVWEDTNQNGIDDDGANGLPGITVNLLDGSGNPTGQTTVTDGSGNYSFTELPAGDYIVEVVLPAGRTFTTQDTGPDTTDSDVDTTTGQTGVITLSEGEVDDTNDAGILPLLGSIGDKVWEDTNQNGIDDDGANGIAGVTVNLLDGSGNPTGQTTVTDGSGNYSFTGLLTGDYIVEVVLPAGRAFTTQDTGPDTTDSDVDTTSGRTGVINLAPGEDDPTNDAGILPLGTIGDKVWEDTNQNGIDDDGANGLPGITVNLLDGSGNPTGQTTVTDGSGNYSFTGLLAGDYIVEVVLPGGRAFTTQDTGPDTTDSDVDTTTGQTGVINLSAGETDNTNDAGILPLGTIGDKVWEDTNQNGIDDDGANGLPGITVNLLDGSGNPTGQTTVTDGSGNYSFTGLLAGDYIVEVVLPAGRTFTTQDTGPDTTDSDVDTTTGQTGVISLAAGEDDPTNDAGILPLLGSLGDKVWEDTNQNGIDDDGANGLAGITVNLLDGSGNPTGQTTVTDGSGNYAFTGLLAGDYIVEVVLPAGRTFTTQDTGPDTTDSDVDTTTGQTGVISLAAGEDDPTNDAGILPLLGSLGDKVWEDTNQNGIDDDGANGLAGITVNLLDGSGNPTGQTTVTDGSGNYSFTGLLAGDYIVEVVLPAGRTFTTQDTGPDTTDSDVDTTTGQTGVINLSPGEDDPTNDAGILPLLGSLGDKVWEDTNQNGIDDDGANGLAGITVNLLDGSGNPTGQTTVTDGSGNYSFTGLLAGDYIVEVVLPAGRAFTTQDTGPDTTDSDVDTTTGQTGVINLSPGEDDPTNDAGILPLGTIGDKVWEDTNQNGIDDDGANGLPGITVNLLDGSGNPTGQTTVTDGSGNYSFTGLLAGDYIVEVVLPGGRTFTTQDTGPDTTDSDVDTTTGQTGVINLSVGETDNTNDAGILPLLGSLGDKVWEDTNQNGIDDDGANGLPGITVNLLDGSGNPTGQTTVTDGSGNYSFTGLLAGDYIVEVVLPGGRTFTTQDDPGATEATDSDVDTTTGQTGVISLAAGADDLTNDAGILPLLGSLGDKVWEDTNQNGIDDDGANGLPGITVNLLDGSGNPTGQTTVTDGSGNYSFTGLLAGDYIVEVVLPGGRTFTTQDTGPDTTDSDVDTTTGQTGVINLSPGEDDPTNDAGILPLLGAIGDKVWEDTNQNGIDDDGVNGLAGITVNLLDGSGNPTGQTTVTDANGNYTFLNLLTGDYIVEVVLPGGRTFTTQDTGPDTTDSDVDTTTGQTGVINLAPGEIDLTNDAGILPLLGSLGDKVWEDTNQNGIDDDGANGLAGVTVNLLDGSGNPTGQSTGTDGSGNYSFTGLLAGDYIVEVVLPAGRTFTTQDTGPDTTDSDVDTTTGQTGVINLAPGEDDPTNDAGILPLLGAIGDKVWEDTNQNGIDDDGANGLPGITVNLLDGSGNPTGQTTVTDGSGNYLFTGVLAGDYIVEVVLPGGRTFTTQDTGPDTTDSDVDTTTGQTGVITLAAGASDLTNDAGILPLLGSLGDKVWEDTNQNGIDDDGANGLAGITVNLLDGSGNPTGQTTVTDGSGNYSFTGLLTGDYIVEVVLPGGRTFTTQDTGPDTTDSDVDTTTGQTGVINLSPGEDDPTNDAGILPLLGAIGDKVWEDTNQNGIDDDGANGLAGITVNLLDGSGNPTGQTTVTDGSGNYSFTGLLAGDYIVEVVLPAGRGFTAQDTGPDTTDSDVDTTTGQTGVISLAAGADDLTNDAGILPLLGSLGDKVWEDTNQNGIDDDGANGLAGITVNLLDGSGNPTGQTTVTDGSGNYSFTGLLTGDYIVEVVLPAGRGFTAQDTGPDTTDSDVDTTTGQTGVINLSPGEDDPTNDAGILPLGTIGDKVWEDTNQNGIDDDGANGLAGVTVNLLDGSGNPTGQSTGTDGSGNYSFTDLLAGDYIVEVVLPAGRSFTIQNNGPDTTDSDVDTTTGQTGVINLAPGEDDPTNDAGILPLLGAIGDKVWEDTNQNGIDDDGANGLAGITVNLLDGSGNPTGQTTVTDGSGNYLFSGVLAGDYIVEVVLPAGRTFTAQDTGPDTTDSDVDTTTGQTGVITLAAGGSDLTNDAGILPLLGSLGDKVWEDTNQNGIDDDGANGLAGITVNLLDGSGNPTGQTTVTDGSGNYSFTGLLTGDYIVEVVLPAGRGFTAQDTGPDTTDSDVDTTTGQTGVINLSPGEDDPTNDAGILPLGGIGDKVWEDTNQNGIDDDGANGLAGVTVNLLDGSGNPTGQTTVTDGSGNYSFTDLLAGDYIVEVVLPAGRGFTAQDIGPDTTDSDVDTTTGQTGVINLSAGETDSTNDAGILPLGTIGDKVWEDTNQNGIDDDGANGIAGVTVNLLDGAGNPTGQSTGTDGSGNYSFTDLLAGDYIVEVALPAGRTFTTQDTGPDTTDSDVDTTTGQTGVINLAPGEDDPTNDAGILPLLGAIGDKVWEDTNQNGIDDDGANGFPGVTVNLLDGSGNPTGQTTVTDGSGNYLFTGVLAGDYIVEVVLPAGRGFTAQDTGPDTTDSDVDTTTGQTGVITLAAGGSDLTNDAGILPLGTIGDKVWEDTNENGIDDDGANGLPGITVNLLDGSGNPTGQTMVTDGSGNYSFTDLLAGDYIVEVVVPTWRTFTTQDTGPDTTDSDVDTTTGQTSVINLSPGEDDPTNDAGVLPINPVIGLAKDLTAGPTANPAGNWEMEFTFLIENLGDVDLTNVTLTDDFALTFDPDGTVEAGPTPAGGTCSAGVVDGSTSLAVGESCVAVWQIEVSGLIPAKTYNNTATVTGTPPEGPDVDDISDDGTVTDTDGDGDPDEPGENDPTPVLVPENPVIGLAKDLTAGPTANPAGNWEMEFTFLIENLGDVDLTNVTLTDDFALTFDPDGTVEAGPTPAGGTCSAGVVDGSTSLAVGESCVAVWQIEVSGLIPAKTYNNTATVAGTSPLDTVVTDISDDGTVTDTDGDGDPDEPGENDPTPVLVPENPVIGLAKDLTAGPTANIAGNYEMEFTFLIENLGDVDLTNVTLTDDFALTFDPDGTVEAGPTPAGGTCSAGVVDGSTSLAVGESCVAVWQIEVSGLVAGTVYNNTATVAGTSPLDTVVTDISDDGTVTDTDGDGDPDEPGENDPTPIVVERALLGDKVFLDINNDGIQDPGEEGVAGVVVQVRKTDGTGLVEVTTDADGMWSVVVDPGDYDVAFVLPDGHTFSPREQGSDPELDSNVMPDGQTGAITLTAGEVNNSVDAGVVPLASLGNKVFIDTDGDGVQEEGDLPVPDATVQLYTANPDGTKGELVGTTTTAADGTYLFDGLLPGDYIVVVTPPRGFGVAPQDTGDDDALDNDISPITGESGVISLSPGQNLDTVDAGLVRLVPRIPCTNNPSVSLDDEGFPICAPQVEYPGPFTNAPPTNPGPTLPEVSTPTPPLALTGSNSNLPSTLALAMLAVGGTLLIGARRERDKD